MNKFYKYAPNVWLAECDEEYKRGDIITLDTKYGNEVECEVYNLITTKNDKFYYSIVRLDEPYAVRRAEKYRNSQARHEQKANEWHEKATKVQNFCVWQSL